MELRDALVPFRLKGSSDPVGGGATGTLLRVDVLTDDRDLMSRIEDALCLLRAAVEPVDKIDEAKDRIERGDVDLTVVHVHRADAWPGIAFKLFDNQTNGHPIIVLCGDAEEARRYRKLSDSVIDILPEEAVRDYRFRFLIQAAMLRAELTAPRRSDDELPPVA